MYSSKFKFDCSKSSVKFLIFDNFVFREWKIKVNQVEDLEEDTIEFTAINTFIYNQTLSDGLTGDEIVTVIDPLLTVNK